MDIVNVNISDARGGAARAGYRLHKGLRADGINTKLVVQRSESDDPDVVSPNGTIWPKLVKGRSILDKLPLKAYSGPEYEPFYPNLLPGRLYKTINSLSPDLVQLHWISGGMLRIEEIAKIDAPIVWRLSDMWAFTGGCHYSGDCAKYQDKCGSCPILQSDREIDLSRFGHTRKRRTFTELDLTVVSPSNWLYKEAKDSSILGDIDIRVIHNGLDTSLYEPLDAETSRQALNLPADKRLVLFGAISPVSNPRKGFHKLKDALDEFSDSEIDDVELVIFGGSKHDTLDAIDIPVHSVGYLHDDYSIAMLYSAVDVMVVPSIQDNFPSTVLEPLACGTPCVAFDVGGIPDMIDSRSNGYLATPYESTDLAAGIEWIIEDDARLNELSQAARDTVMENFTLEQMVESYKNLYTEKISG